LVDQGTKITTRNVFHNDIEVVLPINMLYILDNVFLDFISKAISQK